MSAVSVGTRGSVRNSARLCGGRSMSSTPSSADNDDAGAQQGWRRLCALRTRAGPEARTGEAVVRPAGCRRDRQRSTLQPGRGRP